MKIKTESFWMKFFRKLKMDSIAWSLRRLYCPVKKEDLVLEVGSGGNPYYRANILCDAYVDTQERFFEPLIYDRPTVIASVENLPFKDDMFDFVIASHVFEHSADPKKFLDEIQRVGKAGYMEVPDAFMERLTHYGFHRLEITERNKKLLIRKKKDFIQDKELAELFDFKVNRIFPELISKYPFDFHVRYYWSKDSGGIKYKIINPEYEFDWELQTADGAGRNKFDLTSFFKKKILFLARALFSQKRRNAGLDVAELMACVKCKSDNFQWNNDKTEIGCIACGKKYSIYGMKK